MARVPQSSCIVQLDKIMQINFEEYILRKTSQQLIMKKKTLKFLANFGQYFHAMKHVEQ